MAKGISTRLQKYVSQLLKDVDKMGLKLGGLESNLDGVADQLRADITLELKRDMLNMFEKWGRKMEQLLVNNKEKYLEKRDLEKDDSWIS